MDVFFGFSWTKLRMKRWLVWVVLHKKNNKLQCVNCGSVKHCTRLWFSCGLHQYAGWLVSAVAHFSIHLITFFFNCNFSSSLHWVTHTSLLFISELESTVIATQLGFSSLYPNLTKPHTHKMPLNMHVPHSTQSFWSILTSLWRGWLHQYIVWPVVHQHFQRRQRLMTYGECSHLEPECRMMPSYEMWISPIDLCYHKHPVKLYSHFILCMGTFSKLKWKDTGQHAESNPRAEESSGMYGNDTTVLSGTQNVLCGGCDSCPIIISLYILITSLIHHD